MLISKLVGGLLVAMFVGVPASALAAPSTIVVNTTGDWATQQADIQSCTNGTDTCTLRAAIYAASQLDSGITIQFAPSITGTISLSAGSLLVFGDLSIDGPGANVLAIDGSSGSDNGIITDTADALTVDGLTLQNGDPAFALTNDAGGASSRPPAT